MFDDDLFSMFNNNYTATDTEEESSSTNTYSPSSYEQPSQTIYNPYMSDNSYQDDYSTAQNYEEQSSYDSSVRSVEPERTEQRVISQMHTPVIRKEQEAVVLTKTKAKIYLQARMKIVIAMFITIVSALLFVSIFNFVNAAKINATLAEKQITIKGLQESISQLKDEYNTMTDDGYMKQEAMKPTDKGGLGFVESTDSNTTVLEYGEIYTEPVIEELPSNWFNDVCDFFSNLFAA